MKSDIHGQGYGDKHSWKRGYTNQSDRGEVMTFTDKNTQYACKCGARFNHYYDVIPDIFEAIKQAGVSEECSVNSTKETKV